MRQQFSIVWLLGLVAFLGLGCSQPPRGEEPADVYLDTYDAKEPNKITVQHCLIGFRGSSISKPVDRTKAEAVELANELLKRAKSGEDFDKIVEEYTDDSHPGIYSMVNFGFVGDLSPMKDAADRIYERKSMVAAFGDVGFQLEVGGVGMSKHDPKKSPFGFHIIKRIK